MHVTEYRRNAKGNPQNSNQFKVTIKDHSGRKIGSQSWLNADPTIEVKSKLPYKLYLGGGKSDEDHIYFWYNGEYWRSDDEKHQCSFGRYNGDYSNGDCGFPCPDPDPPKEPPEPLPSKPKDGGTEKYNSGWCGVHVHLTKDQPMPLRGYFSFKVDLYLKDGKQKLIKQEMNVPVKSRGPKSTKIQGPLPHELEVSPRSTDTSFSYNGQKWNATDTSRCKFDGKWDGGKQADIDCGFSC